MEEGAKKVSPSKNRRLQRPPADIDDFDEELIPGWMMDLEDWQSEDLIRMFNQSKKRPERDNGKSEVAERKRTSKTLKKEQFGCR